MASFIYHLPVRFHEVDPAGIVFFARVFQYAHDTYEAWLREIGFPLDPPATERGYALPIAHAEADFHKPIRLGQELKLELTPVAVGAASYKIVTKISFADGTPVATVTTVHVCVDPGIGRPQPLPENLRAAIRAYLP